VQATIPFAGAHHPSYQQADEALRVLAEQDVGDKQVRRLGKTIGAERVTERDAAVAAYQDKPLTQRKDVPAGVEAAALARRRSGRGGAATFRRSSRSWMSSMR
jgi:hypothetical protein